MIVATSSGDEPFCFMGFGIGSQAPAVLAPPGAGHGRIQEDMGRQLKSFGLGFDIAQNVGLILSAERKIAKRPVLFAELDVLPGWEVAP